MAGKALGRGWIAGAVLVVAAYGVGLGGIHAPKVGDEYLYRQIVRVTGESGHWLPLRSEEGITDRKPFLFFWTGLAATDGGHVVTLVRLRAPIVAQTLLLALLVFLWARRLTGRRERGLLAAALFLGFFSTFRYGRTFLTNMPEALFTFAAWFGVWLASEVGLAKAPAAYWRRWLGVGLALGVVLLHRSFVLWLPFFAAAKLFLIGERGGDWRRMAREDGPGLALAFVVSGLCFALWPLLDPQPGEILRTFLLDENMGKVNSGGYLRGLVVGDYNLTRIWLGHLFNAGPLAPLVVALPFVVFRA
ncbi:MAG TPA: glycosyltransferase family 39 protein, partial [Bdellovibrionota bacterium]|nr:glycosyltransferase family 39 protein [Bdellovibrionota bacterium]